MDTNNKLPPSVPDRRRILPLTLAGFLVVGLIAGLTIFRQPLTDWLRQVFPSKGCAPTLLLGGNEFRIRTIPQPSDGKLGLPADEAGTAFWVKGTDTNRVFGLSPVSANLALGQSLQPGDKAVVTGADCNSTTYILSAPQTGAPDLTALLSQTKSEITLIVPAGGGSAGLVAKGELTGETIQTFDTPDPAEAQAEISLLNITPSSDGKTIQIEISVLNSGKNAFSLSTSNVALTTDSGAVLSLASSESAFPLKIKPGETASITLTFPRPTTSSATLNILGAEYIIEGY